MSAWTEFRDKSLQIVGVDTGSRAAETAAGLLTAAANSVISPAPPPATAQPATTYAAINGVVDRIPKIPLSLGALAAIAGVLYFAFKRK